ncbi:MAG: Rrf2 family transcriptional regulator [Deltaproteobacteria bacterium]|nr:Rrf2 family transcriptional regulator [Deltaproteobacteria bacterium]MBW1847538.1 Rrf2 family transcriptional regulator [Deltaproteobacteria bacterium]MBW2181600.1 Rrf2 family transcriptional regulator [Deltaproteobacteria bacterium]MBW2364772.1 Rrf2 family transcriptional regulator [Deltaproteobacteria bacterium]
MGFLTLMKSTSYAFHVLFYMAEHSNDDPIQLKTIAESLALPENYLSKVLQNLNRANIIKSIRGAKRGYKLAKNPEAITLLEIIEIFEGPITSELCLLDLNSCIFGGCKFSSAINELTNSTRSILSKNTIMGIHDVKLE